jgi:hypothetical protein
MIFPHTLKRLCPINITVGYFRNDMISPNLLDEVLEENDLHRIY